MKHVLFSVTFLVSTWAFAAVTPVKWSESLVKRLNTKSVQETFCEKSVGLQAQAGCDFFNKNKVNLNQRIKSARIEGKSLFLADGKRQIEIKLTENSTQFAINNKIIDLKDYKNSAALADALKKALPKVAKNTFWMNVAYADEVESYDLMVSTSTLMLQSNFDERWCGYARSFIDVCNQNLSISSTKTQWDMIAGKIKNKKTLSEDERRWLSADADELLFLGVQMNKHAVSLDQADTQKSLKLCPSYSKPALANAQEDINKCKKAIGLKIQMLRDIPEIAKYQQEYLKIDPNHPDVVQQRKELAEWMEYVTAGEAKAQTPGVRVDAPVQ